MSDDLASRLRDIAEEYLYLDAPLKELKSKLLHEAADKYDDTCVEIARMNIEISNLKVELIKTKAVRNLPEKTKLAEQLTEARAEIERLKVRATEKSEMIRELLREQKDFVQETFNCRKLIGEQEKQLSEARAEIERLNKALEYVKAAHKKLSQLPSDLQIIEDQLDKLTEARALLDEMASALKCIDRNSAIYKSVWEETCKCDEALAKYNAWKGGAG